MAADTFNIPAYLKLLCASGAGVSGTLVCYPLDVLKLNMQVAGELGAKREQVTTVQFAKQIYQDHGLAGIYAGLGASIMRQAIYTGARLGLYQILNDEFTRRGRTPNFIEKCGVGVMAGIVGGFVGLPPDVVLTRMAVDRRLPPEKRRNYRNIFHGLSRVYHDEGGKVLFRGLGPTILRACVVNVSQLGSYFQSKQILLAHNWIQDDSRGHLVCSCIASVVATTCTLPPDMAKTRMQNQKVIDGKMEYRSTMEVWLKVVRYEGIFALWKGYTPLLVRNAPQFIVTFLAYEKLILICRLLFVRNS